MPTMQVENNSRVILAIECFTLFIAFPAILYVLRRQVASMDFEKMSESEILDIANPIMDNLMEASTRIDHERHIRDFTDRMKKIVTKEYLQKVCEEYQAEKGFFSERKPIAVFKRPNSAAIVWKQSFTKAKGEFVAEMVLVYQNGRFLCDHAMVF